MFFVGVAGGIKDVTIGDVVACTKIYGYASGKDESDFKPRPEVEHPTGGIAERARAEVKKGGWLKRIRHKSSSEPRAFAGPLASGEKVVASTKSARYSLIRSTYSDALALEMEGYGFLKAARENPGVEALVVRGVSDLLDGKSVADTRGSQELAAQHASAFAFEVLATFEVPRDSSGKEPSVPLGLRAVFPIQESSQDAGFENCPKIDSIIRNVKIGAWDAAREAAIQILESTDEFGKNELFGALLTYHEYPYDEDIRWGAIQTIESFAELAPWFIDRGLLARMAKHPDFTIRSSAACICMSLAQFAPDRIPMDLLFKLSSPKEDWYVMAPATAALKTMARKRPSILQYFFMQLQSPDADVREHAAHSLADIAQREPEILDPKKLEQELARLEQANDRTAARIMSEAIPRVKKAKRRKQFKYVSTAVRN